MFTWRKGPVASVDCPKESMSLLQYDLVGQTLSSEIFKSNTGDCQLSHHCSHKYVHVRAAPLKKQQLWAVKPSECTERKEDGWSMMQHVFALCCKHVFRQSRAVLRRVTPHALLHPPPRSLLPLHFIPFPNVCCARSPFPPIFFFYPSSLPYSRLSHAVLQFAGYSSPNSSTEFMYCSQQLFCFKGMQGHWFCASPALSLRVHMRCLSCRSLLCAGGPFSPPEEAGLLPHTDVHPSYNGCCAVPSLFLDQQGVRSCTHSCRYAPLLPSQSCLIL